MTRMRTTVILSLFLLFAGCITARVSTPDERALANTAVTTFESALSIAEAAHKITPEKVALARVDVVDLRKLIADSETVPMGWADLYQRALGLGVKWAIATK